MTQEEKIKDLEQRVAIMGEVHSALCEELEHFKRVAAGQKGRMQQLSKEVQKWKDYGKEADELNEARISKIDDLKNAISLKELFISQLQSQVSSLIEAKKELECMVNALKANKEYYENLSWWERLTYKKK